MEKVAYKTAKEAKDALEAMKEELAKLSTNPEAKTKDINKLTDIIEEVEKIFVKLQKEEEKRLDKNIDKIALGAAASTKATLDKQKKVSMTLEPAQGQPEEEVVILNDVKYVIPRGVTVEVPEEISKILMEKMQADMKVLKRLNAMNNRMVEAHLL